MTPSPDSGAVRRVLIVDDDADNAESLALLLTSTGHETAVAHDGPDALQQLPAFRPHVVLLDLGLPVMDGYETCHRLRAEPAGHGVLVVALTGWGQEEDRRKTREAGFDRHLVKPVDPSELLQLLATHGDDSAAR